MVEVKGYESHAQKLATFAVLELPTVGVKNQPLITLLVASQLQS